MALLKACSGYTYRGSFMNKAIAPLIELRWHLVVLLSDDRAPLTW